MSLRNILAVVAIVSALICAGGWLRAQQELREARQTSVADTLDPIREMLKENAVITGELQGAEYAGPGDEFVGAYLSRIRHDGVPKLSGMKQRIDRLIDNDTAILALLAKYSTHARTPAFRASAERFRDYAISLRDRWQSVPEIFMAGGNLPAAAPPYPADFERALASEHEARR
jgi:hypothetical protein